MRHPSNVALNRWIPSGIRTARSTRMLPTASMMAGSSSRGATARKMRSSKYTTAVATPRRSRKRRWRKSIGGVRRKATIAAIARIGRTGRLIYRIKAPSTIPARSTQRFVRSLQRVSPRASMAVNPFPTAPRLRAYTYAGSFYHRSAWKSKLRALPHRRFDFYTIATTI